MTIRRFRDSKISAEMPTERLVQDIEVVSDVLQKIFTANECIVSGDDVRSGHREQGHDGTGPLHSRLRNNQRKDSQFLMRLLLTMIMKTLPILYMTLPAISLMMM